MNSELEEVAGPLNSALLRIGFRLTDFFVDAKCFGNAVALYAKEGVEIRVIRDRGEIRCEIRRPEQSWNSVYLIREALNADARMDVRQWFAENIQAAIDIVNDDEKYRSFLTFKDMRDLEYTRSALQRHPSASSEDCRPPGSA